jgi:hypothetical protein
LKKSSLCNTVSLSVQDSCNEALAGEPILPPPEAALYSPEVLSKAARTAGAGGGTGKEFEKSVDVLEDLFDKLFHLNKKLELQEEDIFRLGLTFIFYHTYNVFILTECIYKLTVCSPRS